MKDYNSIANGLGNFVTISYLKNNYLQYKPEPLINSTMKFNRQDIIQAYYLFGDMFYKNDKNSFEYKCIERTIKLGYQPKLFNFYKDLTSNGKLIFENLVKKINMKNLKDTFIKCSVY